MYPKHSPVETGRREGVALSYVVQHHKDGLQRERQEVASHQLDWQPVRDHRKLCHKRTGQSTWPRHPWPLNSDDTTKFSSALMISR